MHDFYREKKYPTLDFLLIAVKEKGVFTGERTTLGKVLRKMSFKHKEVNDKRYIYEQQCLQAYRFIHILSGTKQENTEYGKLDIAYGFR